MERRALKSPGFDISTLSYILFPHHKVPIFIVQMEELNKVTHGTPKQFCNTPEDVYNKKGFKLRHRIGFFIVSRNDMKTLWHKIK